MLRGSEALGSVGVGSSSAGFFRDTKFNYKLFSSSCSILNKETKDMLYKKGFPAIYLDMEANKQDILKDTKNKAGIYLITNNINKKHYVGKSSNLSQRFYNYFSLGFLELNKDTKIFNIIRKLGYNNFSLTILEFCDDPYLISSREQYYIDIFKPLYNTRRFVKASDKSKVKKTSKRADEDFEILKRFKVKFKNQSIPQKVVDLINLAENSSPWDFQMTIEENKKRGTFSLAFTD